MCCPAPPPHAGCGTPSLPCSPRLWGDQAQPGGPLSSSRGCCPWLSHCLVSLPGCLEIDVDSQLRPRLGLSTSACPWPPRGLGPLSMVPSSQPARESDSCLAFQDGSAVTHAMLCLWGQPVCLPSRAGDTDSVPSRGGAGWHQRRSPDPPAQAPPSRGVNRGSGPVVVALASAAEDIRVQRRTGLGHPAGPEGTGGRWSRNHSPSFRSWGGPAPRRRPRLRPLVS